jgi:hypothetical protein
VRVEDIYSRDGERRDQYSFRPHHSLPPSLLPFFLLTSPHTHTQRHLTNLCVSASVWESEIRTARCGNVTHVSELEFPDADPPCHFCCEQASTAIHDESRLQIVSGGKNKSLILRALIMPPCLTYRAGSEPRWEYAQWIRSIHQPPLPQCAK